MHQKLVVEFEFVLRTPAPIVYLDKKKIEKM